MKKYFLAFFLFFPIIFFAAPPIAGAYTIFSGTLPSSTTWTTDGSPYIVQGAFDIPNGVTLNINPGVVVKCAGGVVLTVDGSLVANGTLDDKIYFTTTDDDSVGGTTSDSEDFSPVGALGLLGNPVSNISISNAEIRNLYYGITLNGQGFHMSASFDHVKISGDDTTIHAQFAYLSLSNIDLIPGYNEWAMIIGQGGGTTINNMSIHDGASGIVASNVSVVADDLNISHMLGNAILINNGNLSLSDSTIDAVYSGLGGAAVDFEGAGNSSISSTTISDIYGTAINVSQGGIFSFSNLSVSSSTEGFEINNDANSSEMVSSSTISNIDDAAISVTSGTLKIIGTAISGAVYGIESLGDAIVNVTSSSLTSIDQYGAAELGTNNMNAEGNYWGDPSGPYNPNSNPAGFGVAVTDNVDFSNWLGINSTTTISATTTSATTTSATTTSALEPVIVIPGIFGSEEENGVWIMDPILHAYDDLVDTLAANGYSTSSASTTLFTFPYDWKNSNVVTAQLLKQKIAQVKNICGCSKVNLVAHSMGGLVARQYIQSDDYGNDVDKVIFLGTPHLGAPEDYMAWEGAEVYSKGLDPSGEAMIIILHEYAMHQGYLNLFNYIHDKVLSVEELLPIYAYKMDYQTGQPESYSSADYPMNNFLENLEATKSNLSRVQVFNIVGDLGASSTIDGLSVVKAPEIAPLYADGKPFNSVDGQGMTFGNGDGTVPLSSASDLPVYDTLDQKHTNLPDYAEEDVFKILTGENVQTIIRNPNRPDIGYLIMSVFSPVHILVTAPDGKRIGYDPATGQEINEISGAFYSGTSTENEYVTIPNPLDGHYHVESVGYASGGYTITASDVSSSSVTDTSISGTTSVGTESSNIFTVSSSTVLSIDTATGTQENISQPQQNFSVSFGGGGSHIGTGSTISQKSQTKFDPDKVMVTLNGSIDEFIKNYKIAEARISSSASKKNFAKMTSTSPAETQTASVYQAVPSSFGKSLKWIGGQFISMIKGATAHLFNFIKK